MSLPNNLSPKQIIVPLLSVAVIVFMYFGPIQRTIFENIILSLVLIGANAIEYSGKPLAALGFRREQFNAKNLLVRAPLTAFGLFVVYVFAVVPTVEWITGIPIDYSSMDQVRGDLPTAITWMLIVWATAAFGEEIIFRGYLMRQFVKFFGDSPIPLALNILLFSSFFGYMHMQQGLTGQLVAGTTGALLSLIFYNRKYDLWFMVVLHGVFNTLGILSFYFGLA
ncbi:CPBP family intramembrane metalloprotease [Cryomorphaceae bacterium]|nr:CPBP family intramembrane metalloprotease [Cryomorphaceae bacterium]